MQGLQAKSSDSGLRYLFSQPSGATPLHADYLTEAEADQARETTSEFPVREALAGKLQPSLPGLL